MEIMITYWWIIKLFFAIIIIGILYVAFFKKKFESKFWNVVALLAVIFAFIMPVKLDLQTKQIQNQSNYKIEQMRKDLPERKVDNTFKENVNKEIGIKKEDLK